MTEILDEASRVEMAEREALVVDQLARARLAAKQAGDREAARAGQVALCVDCESPIPEARRLAVPGCLRCIECERAKSARSLR